VGEIHEREVTMSAANISKSVFGIIVAVFLVYCAGQLTAEDAKIDSKGLLKEQKIVAGTITEMTSDLV